jgi:hypothetical protein
MAHYMAQVALAADTNLPRDVAVNTWHFESDPEGVSHVTIAELIAELVADVYRRVAPPNTQTVASLLSASLATSGHRCKVYDMSTLPPHEPLANLAFTVPATGGNAAPAEVALCLSYKADPAPPIPAARLRGRIYFGPFALDGSKIFDSATGRPISTGAGNVVDTILNAVEDMSDRLYASPSIINWSTWSKAGGVLAPVTSMYIDDAWDTQRRRGPAPTTRRTLAVVRD